MNGLARHFALSLRLHLRNRLALLYGYLFPLIFLVVFWVLYRHEQVPLLRHMGELLTVSVLGGACFGLPTSLVSERERGVWRRYRLAPVPAGLLIGSTVAARYVIVLSAGLLQLGAALAAGMTMPAHPFALGVAFTLVAFAFIGLGLVIATFADNVPAVQALGQCIFLPMLIIGGVAVRLASLPAWAQHVSAFFPGRYAVEALQAAVSGAGLPGMKFCLLALALTGGAGVAAGTLRFRWESGARGASRHGATLGALVLIAWLAVGALAERRGRIAVATDAQPPAATVAPLPAPPRPPWEKITARDVAGINFRVPPDSGVVAPIAAPDELPDDATDAQVEGVRKKLPDWQLVREGSAMQRVRYALCVAAVPDAVQQPVERYLPLVVLQYLTDTYPKDQLIKILAAIVLHPEEGLVVDEITELGINGVAGDPGLVRERSYLYAIKFIARLTGRVEP